ncbi:MAG: hypothetical protein ABSD88_07695 [Candidatus Korobacteraceae bacterium]
MRENFLIVAVILVQAAAALAQPPRENSQPQVRVNYLNVCSPADEEGQLIAGTLERIPAHPKFAADFEVARGRSTLGAADLKLREMESAPDGKSVPGGTGEASQWVRIRREFPEGSPFVNVQYSFSMTRGQVVETLTLRAREARDVMQVSISASSNAEDAAQVARLNTPAERIRLERFGRSSVVLARCPAADQSRFEPLFGQASALLAAYRGSLQVATVVPAEIARFPKARPGKATAGQNGRGR